MFSKRTQWELTPNQFISSLKEIQKDNLVLDLSESNPTKCGFDYSAGGILNPLSSSQNIFYNPTPQGSQEAREVISQYYQKKNCTISPERIFLVSSTSEGYSFLFRLLVNTEERILVPKPSYPLFQYLVELNDAKLDFYFLVYDKAWRIDLQSLKDAIQHDTKAIILVNPNNPTGSFVKKEEIEAIMNICRDRNIALICDEVFLDYPLEDNFDPLSLVEYSDVLTFVLNGVSKTLGLPQMKLSWITINGPQNLVEEAKARLEIIVDTYLSVNTPVQNALVEWLPNPMNIQQQILKRVRTNYLFLKNAIKYVNSCQLLPSQGGWYAVLKLPNNFPEDKWVMNFLKKDFVFVHPGYFFDFDQEPVIVISLLPSLDIFKEAVERIIRRLKVQS